MLEVYFACNATEPVVNQIVSRTVSFSRLTSRLNVDLRPHVNLTTRVFLRRDFFDFHSSTR